MNEEKLKEILNRGNHISLSVEEKNDLKNRIVSQMNAINLKYSRNSSRSLWAGKMFYPRLVPYFAVVMIFALSSGGVMAAAQVSLPGDLLYGVKVGVNEKVKNVFIVSTEAKAKREIQLVSKRLEETRSLALTEKLDSKSRSVVENQLEKHTTKVRGYIKESESENDLSQVIDLQTQLEVTLALNERALTNIEPVSAEISPVVAIVRTELASVSEDKANLQNDLSVKEDTNISVIAEKRLKAAKSVTDEAEKLLVSAPPSAQYQDQIYSVKEDIEIGQELFNEGKYQDAINYFDQSFKTSSEIKFFVENSEQEEASRVFIQNKSIQLGIPQIEENGVPIVEVGELEGTETITPKDYSGSNVRDSIKVRNLSENESISPGSI